MNALICALCIVFFDVLNTFLCENVFAIQFQIYSVKKNIDSCPDRRTKFLLKRYFTKSGQERTVYGSPMIIRSLQRTLKSRRFSDSRWREYFLREHVRERFIIRVCQWTATLIAHVPTTERFSIGSFLR